MVLSKLSVSENPTDLDNSRAKACRLAVGAGGGCLNLFSLFFLPLWETARYIMKYCLERR